MHIFFLALSEWIEENFAERLGSIKLKQHSVTVIVSAVVTLELVFVGLYATLYQPPLLTTQQHVFAQTVSQPQQLFTSDIPKFTETVAGEERLPIHVLLVADNQDSLVTAFKTAGWFVADAGSLNSFWKLGVAQLNHSEYSNAPMSPAFWNTQVQTIGFEQAVDGSIDQRHHVRVWSTLYKTSNGRQIFVATANQDAQVKWVVSHQINPDIDQERNFLLNSLINSGAVTAHTTVPFVDPESVGGSEQRFFTDGQLEIIEL